MENAITLNEWLSKHSVNNKDDIGDYLNLFYDMDRSMKDLHNSNFYVDNFNINTIYVNDRDVYYTYVKKMDNDDKDYLISKNIYYLSCLALGVYNDCLSYIRPTNKEGLKENYSTFSSSVPKDVQSYYYGIFVDDANKVYLSDFIDTKREREGMGRESSAEKANVKKLSTPYGKMYMSDDDNKIAAFALTYIFPAIIFLLALIIPIIIFLKLNA